MQRKSIPQHAKNRNIWRLKICPAIWHQERKCIRSTKTFTLGLSWNGYPTLHSNAHCFSCRGRMYWTVSDTPRKRRQGTSDDATGERTRETRILDFLTCILAFKSRTPRSTACLKRTIVSYCGRSVLRWSQYICCALRINCRQGSVFKLDPLPFTVHVLKRNQLRDSHWLPTRLSCEAQD